MDRVDYQSLIIQDLINDHESEKLDLNPWYQRRSVWTSAQKSYLINTLFERKPIPAIYIRHSINLEKQISIKEVVDGQQRSRAVLEYCENKFSANIIIGEKKKFFRDLTKTEKEKILLTPLPIGFLLGATDEDVVDIFARINSVSKTLNYQEKRNAKYSGEMKQLCLQFASQRLNFWRKANIFTANDIARMGEVQFVSELVQNLLDGLSGLSQKNLDEMYRQNENSFPQAGEIFNVLNNIFNVLMELDEGTFKDTIFNRPPVLFSLVLCLQENLINKKKNLTDVLYKIDAVFNDEDNIEEDVVKFRTALAATTQQKPSRLIRHNFINSYF